MEEEVIYNSVNRIDGSLDPVSCFQYTLVTDGIHLNAQSDLQEIVHAVKGELTLAKSSKNERARPFKLKSSDPTKVPCSEDMMVCSEPNAYQLRGILEFMYELYLLCTTTAFTAGQASITNTIRGMLTRTEL